MTAASVAVVGAGVMGASVAWHLAARGWSDVVLLDRASGPGEGSTGRATGGFRAQFATAVNVRLSLLAREKLLRFRDEVGADPGYAPLGYLWIATDERHLVALAEARRVQHGAGLGEAVAVGIDEIRGLNPAVAPGGILGGAFGPTDGFLRPLEILRGYLAAAERLGARVEWGVDVAGARRGAAGRVTALETSRGPVEVERVVNAAGAWAGALAERLGVALPVMPLRRQVAVTAPCELLPARMPMTIFVGDGFHFRVRDGRVLLLLPSPGEPERPFDTRVDPEWIREVTRIAGERVPVLRGMAIDRAACWAGLYEMSPDRHAILGRSRECENLYFINGSSGHGVMHAPALGQLLAEIIAEERATSLDVSALRPDRFVRGQPSPASELL